jgi:hypothetical protein
VLVAIHRGSDLPCSGMADPQFWHLDVLPVRRPNRRQREGGHATPGKYLLWWFYIGERFHYLAPITRWGYARPGGDLGGGSPSFCWPLHKAAQHACDWIVGHGEVLAPRRIRTAAMSLIRSTTHQYSLPWPLSFIDATVRAAGVLARTAIRVGTSACGVSSPERENRQSEPDRNQWTRQ